MTSRMAERSAADRPGPCAAALPASPSTTARRAKKRKAMNVTIRSWPVIRDCASGRSVLRGAQLDVGGLLRRLHDATRHRAGTGRDRPALEAGVAQPADI